MKIFRHPLILGAMGFVFFTVSSQAQDTGTTGTTEQADTTVTTTTTGGTTGGTPPPSAYEQLSTGGRKIADAMFDGQSVTADGPEAWSIEQIAAAKQDGQGWGEIFHQLKSEGLTDARNLGELVSGRYQPTTATGDTTTTGESAAAVTDGASGKSSGSATGQRRYTSGKGRAYGTQSVSGTENVGPKGSDGARRYGKNVSRGSNSSGHVRGGDGITTAGGSTHSGNQGAGIKGGNSGAGAVHGNQGGNHGGSGGGKGRP